MYVVDAHAVAKCPFRCESICLMIARIDLGESRRRRIEVGQVDEWVVREEDVSGWGSSRSKNGRAILLFNYEAK